MAVYIQFGMGSGARQPEILELIRGQGMEVIQTSDGLCARGDGAGPTMVEKLLEEKGLSQGLCITRIDAGDRDLAPDVRAFLK